MTKEQAQLFALAAEANVKERQNLLEIFWSVSCTYRSDPRRKEGSRVCCWGEILGKKPHRCMCLPETCPRDPGVYIIEKKARKK